MYRKRMLWMGLLFGITLSALVTASARQNSTPTSTRPNNTEFPRRTIPKEFGHAVGTVTDAGEPALVMEAADGTIRVVPFYHGNSIGVFPRN